MEAYVMSACGVQVSAFQVTLKTPSGEETIEVGGEAFTHPLLEVWKQGGSW